MMLDIYLKKINICIAINIIQERGIDLLVANIGTVGKSIVIKEENDFLIAWNLFLIVVNKELCIPEFIKFYFDYLLKNNTFSKMLSGGTVKFINKTKIGDIEIPNKNMQLQREIVKVMTVIENIIKKRKEEISLLDELIKSKFVDMFGDPVRNDKKWERVACKKLVSKIGSGATPKGGNSSYKEEGISLIRSMNVYNNTFQMKDLAFIDDEQAKKLDNVTVEKDDILLNITGASVARCCIVPEELIPARVNQHVSIIRCKQDKVNPIFLSNMLTNDSYQKLLWSIATSGGATREALTKQQVEDLEVIIPTKELQQQFAIFVHQVDKLKFAIQKSLYEIQTLFDALMQEYFN